MIKYFYNFPSIFHSFPISIPYIFNSLIHFPLYLFFSHLFIPILSALNLFIYLIFLPHLYFNPLFISHPFSTHLFISYSVTGYSSLQWLWIAWRQSSVLPVTHSTASQERFYQNAGKWSQNSEICGNNGKGLIITDIIINIYWM